MSELRAEAEMISARLLSCQQLAIAMSKGRRTSDNEPQDAMEDQATADAIPEPQFYSRKDWTVRAFVRCSNPFCPRP